MILLQVLISTTRTLRMQSSLLMSLLTNPISHADLWRSVEAVLCTAKMAPVPTIVAAVLIRSAAMAQTTAARDVHLTAMPQPCAESTVKREKCLAA
ncbi:hypothetical protein LB505_008110 [Fusarium chuoi]|nr:hypothetical protein LB505_008110 [Fusarium chuoi]